MKRLLATALSLGVLAIVPAAASAGELGVQVYNPGRAGVFPVSSEIITGDKESVLVDAQFSRRDALALVDRIKATGKPLKTVYISHSDPDYYFGLQYIQEAFPGVKIVATPQTVAAIQATKDGKLAYWGPVLKEDAPKRIVVPEPVTGDTLTVDGLPLVIKGMDGPAPDRTFVWIPSNKAVVGGVVVVANTHVWMADTQTPASRRNWLKTLADIEALQPKVVVPGHFLPNADGSQPFTTQTISFTRKYIVAFEDEASGASDAATLATAMKRRYPGLAGEDGLELSAKVIKGEVAWPAGTPAKPYPAAGRKLELRFGELVFELNFKDGRTMSFIGTAGPMKGVEDSVEYKAVELRPNVYMVYWHEPKVGANVVHVQDFEKGVVYTNIARPDGSSLHLSGGLRFVGAAN